MNNEETSINWESILRWIARVSSILLFAFVLFRIFIPDPSITEPVPKEDWFLLSLWGVAILGLLLAWIWEFQGAVIAIVTMFLREVAWIVIKGGWEVSFLMVWAIIIPPAILYLVAWRMEQTRHLGQG